jgi:hypothetical protein
MPNEINVEVNAKTRRAENNLDRFKKSATKVGLALSAMGAASGFAIKGLLGLTFEQQNAMNVLANAVDKTGVSFASVENRIKSVTSALQKKTNFGDEEQLRALALMVPMLGSVDKALTALPAVMDAATTKQVALATVAGTLTRALSGQVNTAITVGMKFDETAGFAERLAQVEGAIGDAAEANVNPITQMNNALGDLGETIGESLLPIITPLVEDVTRMAENLQKLNPEILKWGTGLLAALAAFGLLVGPLTLIAKVVIPVVTTAAVALGAAVAALGGPLIVGAVIAGLSGMFIAWKTNFMGMQDITKAFMEWHDKNITPFFKRMGRGLVDAFGNFGIDLPKAWEFVKEGWGWLEEKTGEVVENTKDTVEELIFVKRELMVSGLHATALHKTYKKQTEELKEQEESLKKQHETAKALVRLMSGGFAEQGVGSLFGRDTIFGVVNALIGATRKGLTGEESAAGIRLAQGIASGNMQEAGTITPEGVRAIEFINQNMAFDVVITGNRWADAQGNWVTGEDLYQVGR